MCKEEESTGEWAEGWREHGQYVLCTSVKLWKKILIDTKFWQKQHTLL